MITNKDSKDSKYKNMISINACYLPENDAIKRDRL